VNDHRTPIARKPLNINGAKKLIKVSLLISLILMLSLASGSEYAFGTKVLSTDTDIGRSLNDMPNGTTIAYLDTGAPGYGEEDAVYLHVPKDEPDSDPHVNDNDVRLTAFQGHIAGSKVASQDIDMDKRLTLLPATINYLNLRGGQEYDLEDPIYLHQVSFDNYSINISRGQTANNTGCICGNGEAAADIGGAYQERLPYLGSQNPFVKANYIVFTDGYKLLILDQLISDIPEVVGEWQGSDIEVIHGTNNNYYHVLNTWLVKIAQIDTNANKSPDNGVNSCNTTCIIEIIPANKLICTNDIRLSTNGELIAGTKVVNFDIDQSKLLSFPPLLSFPGQSKDTAEIMYFDANGNGMYDSSDDVYLDFPDEASESSVKVNDVRLSGPV